MPYETETCHSKRLKHAEIQAMQDSLFKHHGRLRGSLAGHAHVFVVS